MTTTALAPLREDWPSIRRRRTIFGYLRQAPLGASALLTLLNGRRLFERAALEVGR